jgi:hypothetical protein
MALFRPAADNPMRRRAPGRIALAVVHYRQRTVFFCRKRPILRTILERPAAGAWMDGAAVDVRPARRRIHRTRVRSSLAPARSRPPSPGIHSMNLGRSAQNAESRPINLDVGAVDVGIPRTTPARRRANLKSHRETETRKG